VLQAAAEASAQGQGQGNSPEDDRHSLKNIDVRPVWPCAHLLSELRTLREGKNLRRKDKRRASRRLFTESGCGGRI
jgi:hypothetical protein